MRGSIVLSIFPKHDRARGYPWRLRGRDKRPELRGDHHLGGELGGQARQLNLHTFFAWHRPVLQPPFSKELGSGERWQLRYGYVLNRLFEPMHSFLI